MMSLDEKLATMDTIIGSITFLIDNPDAQMKKHLAVNDRFEECLPTDPAACYWCAIGRVAYDLNIAPAVEAGVSTGHTLALNLVAVYTEVDEIMAKLSISRFSFIQANDMPIKMSRTKSLINLRDKLIDHRNLMTTVAA